MRIGIFGGTFDPVHDGHLIIAEQAREQAGLDEVWFVPSARPPHKLDRPISPFDRRAEMLQLATAGNPRFRVETMERDRPGPSYTADTLDDLRRHHPRDEFNLILGADMLADLPKWHQPQRVLQAATLLAAARPGWRVVPAADLAAALGLPPQQVRLETVQIPLIGISGSDLRARAAAGRSLLYFVPRAVEVFIREKRLYAAPGRPDPV